MRRVQSAVVSLLALILPFAAPGVTLAVEFDDSGALGLPADDDLTLGFAFRPTADITVDGLGFQGPDSFGSPVRLYDATGRVLAAALVLSRDPQVGTEALPYNLAPITPLLLSAGATDFVSGYLGSGNIAFVTATDPVEHPFVEEVGPVSQVGLGVPRTKEFSFRFAGPFDRFTPVNFAISTPVPLPASAWLLLSGLAFVRRRHARTGLQGAPGPG